MDAITVGTRVIYSRTWLDSIGQLSGDMATQRGIVREICGTPEYGTALVQWLSRGTDRLSSQSRPLIRNLTPTDWQG